MTRTTDRLNNPLMPGDRVEIVLGPLYERGARLGTVIRIAGSVAVTVMIDRPYKGQRVRLVLSMHLIRFCQ